MNVKEVMDIEYSVEKVIKYLDNIDGNCTEVKRLENNYIFMMMAINYTSNKKIYSYCSNKVKNNYHFVKFIIRKFSCDIDFINEVARNYLKTQKEEKNQIELILIMLKLTKNDEKSQVYYEYMSTLFYLQKLKDLKFVKDNYKKDDSNLGFLLILDEFSDSKIVTYYFARKFINEMIFSEFDLEKKIHNEFSSFIKLESYSIVDYLLEILFIYDSYLANYTQKNLNVLSDVKKRIDAIKGNWNNYILKKEQSTNVIALKDYYQYKKVMLNLKRSQEKKISDEKVLVYFKEYKKDKISL